VYEPHRDVEDWWLAVYPGSGKAIE